MASGGFVGNERKQSESKFGIRVKTYYAVFAPHPSQTPESNIFGMFGIQDLEFLEEGGNRIQGTLLGQSYEL